jgi:hypothetical protein
VIDQSKYALTIRNNDQVTLTASVPPISSDIRLTQTTVPADGATLTAGDVVTVTLAYGSNAVAPEPFTLEADWDQGLVDGYSSNYIDVFDYVPGSATNADDGTVPVIDLQNRKVTWNIPTLTQSVSDHTVSYQLRIKSDITTYSRMTTSVHSQGQLGSTYSSEKTTHFYVLINAPSLTPIPTTTSAAPTPTPGSSASTATPTPTSAQNTQLPALKFLKIELRNVTDSSAQIYLQTSRAAKYTLVYGTKMNKLTSKVSSTSTDNQHLITLDNLEPDTQYFLKIQITGKDGKQASSDIFTFRTATQATLLHLTKENVMLLWNGMVLNNADSTRLIIPRKKALTFILKTDEAQNIADIKLSFQNSSVLGVNSLNSQPPVGEVNLIQVSPGEFSGALESPEVNNLYNLVLKVHDVFGGFATQNVPFSVLITDPITIRDASTKKPIPDAQFSISKLLPYSNTYSNLGRVFPLANRTNTDGEADLVLPAGQYRLDIDAVAFSSAQKDFQINNSSSDYPHIFLSPKFTFVSTITYLEQVLKTGFAFIHEFCFQLTSSPYLRDFSVLLMVTGVVFSLAVSVVLDRLKDKLSAAVLKLLTILWDFVLISAVSLTGVFVLGTGVFNNVIIILLCLCTIFIRFRDSIGHWRRKV